MCPLCSPVPHHNYVNLLGEVEPSCLLIKFPVLLVLLCLLLGCRLKQAIIPPSLRSSQDNWYPLFSSCNGTVPPPLPSPFLVSPSILRLDRQSSATYSYLVSQSTVLPEKVRYISANLPSLPSIYFLLSYSFPRNITI